MKRRLKILIAVLAVILILEVAFVVVKELDVRLPGVSGETAGQETTAGTVAEEENTVASDVPEITETEAETTVDPRSTEPTAPPMTFPPVEESQENTEEQATEQTQPPEKITEEPVAKQTEASEENAGDESAAQTEATTDSNELPQIPF